MKSVIHISHLLRQPGTVVRWHLVLLALFSLGVNFYGINWGLPYSFNEYPGVSANGIDWAPDSLAPLGPLTYGKRLVYREAWLNKYPPLHFMVLSAAYSPYVLYLAMTGGLHTPSDEYPYGFTNPDLALTTFTVIARSVSALMGVALVLVNYLIVRKLYGQTAALIAGVILASSFPIIHYSHNANLDIPQLLWVSCALLCLLYLIEEYKLRYYILLGVFTALSFLTKESIYALFIGIIPIVVFYHIRHVYIFSRDITSTLKSLFDVRLLSGLIIFFLIVVLIFNPFFNYDGLAYHFDFHALRSVRGNVALREASGRLAGELTLLGEYLTFLRQMNGLPVFIMMIGGTVYCLVRYPRQMMLFLPAILAYYIIFIRLHGTHHVRYILPIYLILVWQAGKLGADLLRVKRVPGSMTVGLIAVLLALSVVHGFSVHVLYARDPRYDVEEWMHEHIPAEARILAVGPGYSLPRFAKSQNLRSRTLWDYNGNQIADIHDLEPEYVVIGMSIPRRQERRAEIEAFWQERGFQPAARFKSELPFFVAEIPDLHALNPEIMILRRSHNSEGYPAKNPVELQSSR